ncbi:MAG: DUF488 domain-containing protein [Ferruginibacter sp.]
MFNEAINKHKNVWTIGHSTRQLDEFIGTLQSFQIELVADIRSYPGLGKFPQFNKEALEISLPENNIQYTHLKKFWQMKKSKSGVKKHRLATCCISRLCRLYGNRCF